MFVMKNLPEEPDSEVEASGKKEKSVGWKGNCQMLLIPVVGW